MNDMANPPEIEPNIYLLKAATEDSPQAVFFNSRAQTAPKPRPRSTRDAVKTRRVGSYRKAAGETSCCYPNPNISTKE